MGVDRIVQIGEKFGYFKIIKEVEKKKTKRMFSVECICGTIKQVVLGSLVTGNTTSCGCMRAIKHRDSGERLYRTYRDMKYRCSNPNLKNFKNYGGRGIKVCDEWKNSYIVFREWALKNGYTDSLTIERRDVDGNYEPSNCRWATTVEQNCNMRLLPTNTSGYVGVSWSKKRERWICVLSVNNKSKRIGSYIDKIEAVRARNDYIDKYKLPNKKNKIKEEII